MKCNLTNGVITFICTVFFLLIHVNALSQNHSGLSFNGNLSVITDRTSYYVFEQDMKWVKESLKLEFDISFSNTGMIGHVLTCKSEQVNIFSIFVKKSESSNFLNINFNLNFVNKIISIPIDINKCAYNMWHKILINIEPNKGYASLQIGDIVSEINFESSNLEVNCKYVFGLFDHYLDVYPFAIRALSYKADEIDSFYFPLNEESGNITYDDKNNPMGYVINPDWLYPKHYSWELIAEMDATELVAIFHDKLEANIVIYDSSYSRIYNLHTSELSVQKHNFSESFKFLDRGGVGYLFNNKNSDLFMYNNDMEQNEYSNAIYNYKNNTLKLLSRTSLKNRMHHNSVFANWQNNRLYQFGGYGNFLYYNKFYGYDILSNTWKEEMFSGDVILPRFYSSVASTYRNKRNLAYIFGGYGNDSGIQEDGGKYLYDLYKVDLDNHSVEKIADFNVDLNVVPCKDIILNDEKNSFLTMCYSQYKPHSSIVLYKFNWDTGAFLAVSDSIPLISLEIATRVHLFEDKSANVLICAIQEYVSLDSSTIRLYRLLSSPIINGKVLQSQLESNKVKYGMIFLIIFISSLIAISYYIYRRKKQGSLKIDCPSEIDYSMPHTEVVIEKNVETALEKTPNEPMLNNTPNSIYLIGEFTVIDKDNRDISHLFSAKLRQLFLLILMYSLQRGFKSISSNELSAILWPDKEFSKSRNIRGVSIKHLRDILIGIDGLSLVYSNSKWFFEIDHDLFYCDYIWFMNKETSTIDVNQVQLDDIKHYFSVLRRGSLLKSAEYSWLDAFKAEYEDKIIQDLYPIMLNKFESKQYQLSYKLAQLLMANTPLNEDVAKIEIKSLIGLGDYVKAKVKFRQFALNYYYACNKNLVYEDFTS